MTSAVELAIRQKGDMGVGLEVGLGGGMKGGSVPGNLPKQGCGVGGKGECGKGGKPMVSTLPRSLSIPPWIGLSLPSWKGARGAAQVARAAPQWRSRVQRGKPTASSDFRGAQARRAALLLRERHKRGERPLTRSWTLFASQAALLLRENLPSSGSPTVLHRRCC